ncbi:neprilysin-2-like [Artemia franciscana]|uniref:Uncharacterized protein n=1 Tax=Artemia franciscana TaxID=6661 RepID=A0AA88L2N9_ARTSF|nr:hypothetical protein QYM36_015805 [Artemia franciscana]
MPTNPVLESQLTLASTRENERKQWWKPVTSTEKFLSLFATAAVCVVIALAISLAAVLANSTNSPQFIDADVAKEEALISELPSPRSARFHQMKGREIQIDNADNEVCKTPGCTLAAAELLMNVDESVDPCDDFYKFACGNFEKRTTIPDDRSAVTTFSILSDKLLVQLRQILQEKPSDNEPKPFTLVKNLYKSCMNKNLIEERGLEPMKAIIKELGGWPVLEGDSWDESSFVWYESVYQYRKVGYSVDYFIDFSVTTDLKNSTWRVIDLDQPGLGMPGREYLLKGLEDKVVQAYLNYQIGLATLLGADPQRAKEELTDSVEFEIKLANITMPREERRNASKLYNPMTIRELSEMIPQVPWLDYMNKILEPLHVLTEDERIIVDVPNFFKQLVVLLEQTPARTLANYHLWRATAATVSYMPETARSLQLKYSTVLTGTTERRPRWEECTEGASSSLANAMGSLYVRKFFQEDAKAAAVEMVNDIKETFFEILDTIDWMDEETRLRAKKKAETITTHIAYPEELMQNQKLIDLYKGLELSSDEYLDNALNLTRFGTNYAFGKLREPVNKTDWISHGRPAIVNAFYSSIENSIQFPAGILQGAFFGKNRPTYLNYGAIGWVIGHEITHGFDDQGRTFGPDGNLQDWWEPSTKDNYLERAQCMIQQYGNFSFPELNMNVNGKNTQGENIADNGGIKEAYRAYERWSRRQNPDSNGWDIEKSLPGFSKYNTKQLFWIGAANVWCSKSRPESLKLRILTGAHSPAPFRVRGPFANLPEFSNDFNCPLGSPMNPEKKCAVW